MVGRLKMLAGFGAGYVLGARSGRARFDQIAEKVQQVWRDPRVQEKTDHAQEIVKDKAGQAQQVLKDRVGDRVGEKSGPNGARSTASSTAGAGAHR